MSILKENLDRVKQELETFGIESKIRKAVNGQGRIYYELSSYGRENLDKWLSNDLISEEQIKKVKSKK
jgi:DNA-binding PadR family transcriptional regulator